MHRAFGIRNVGGEIVVNDAGVATRSGGVEKRAGLIKECGRPARVGEFIEGWRNARAP